MTDELRNIISGTLKVTKGDFIQAALIYLRESQTTSTATEKSELLHKKGEIKRLATFANQCNRWHASINEKNYIGEGAEQKVYLSEDGKSVIKTNDTIFYLSWKDYFISLLIHNFLFPSTAYELLGFYQNQDGFFSVVKQPYIASTEPTNLSQLRVFLQRNGFTHKKNNDYFSVELGIILEDLHDENVLTNQGVFFFIDSAIYLLEPSSVS